jgi:hypothetical protein
MPDDPARKARPKRRFRYTLRALLVFITLFMLWGGYHSERAHRERAVEKLVTRHSLGVGYASTTATFAPPIWYQRIVTSIWGERFIAGISFDEDITLADAKIVANLPNLKYVWIQSRTSDRIPSDGPTAPTTRLADGVLPTILADRSLTDVRVQGLLLSDADFAAIAGHRTLRIVSLYQTNVSDDTLTPILSLPRLQAIEIGFFSQVTGKHLGSAPGSGSLQRVACKHTALDPGFASYLSKCPNLTELNLISSPVGDEFLVPLEASPRLRDLSLLETRVTDKSVTSLARIGTLRRVWLPPSLSQSAAGKLRSANPNARVEY